MTAPTGVRQRFAEVVRAHPVDLGLAALLIGVEAFPDHDVDMGLARLRELAESVRTRLPEDGGPWSWAEALAGCLGGEHGFHGEAEDYDDLRSSLLPDVLRRRRGLPILLSVVWLDVAHRVGIPAYGIGLPGRYVVGIGDPDGEHVVVDPWSGGVVLEAVDFDELLGRQPTADELRPWGAVETLLRILANVRGLGARRGLAPARLWAVELSLLLPTHPAELRREHAELLMQRGDFLGAADAWEAYAGVVEDALPEQAQAMRRTAAMSRARLN